MTDHRVTDLIRYLRDTLQAPRAAEDVEALAAMVDDVRESLADAYAAGTRGPLVDDLIACLGHPASVPVSGGEPHTDTSTDDVSSPSESRNAMKHQAPDQDTPEAKDKVVDLMAALEDSVTKAKAARQAVREAREASDTAGEAEFVCLPCDDADHDECHGGPCECPHPSAGGDQPDTPCATDLGEPGRAAPGSAYPDQTGSGPSDGRLRAPRLSDTPCDDCNGSGGWWEGQPGARAWVPCPACTDKDTPHGH